MKTVGNLSYCSVCSTYSSMTKLILTRGDIGFYNLIVECVSCGCQSKFDRAFRIQDIETQRMFDTKIRKSS